VLNKQKNIMGELEYIQLRTYAQPKTINPTQMMILTTANNHRNPLSQSTTSTGLRKKKYKQSQQVQERTQIGKICTICMANKIISQL
jgi:hypothetical protein